MSEKYIHDPATYRKCSEPHESIDAANDALVAFLTDVRESRIKHRLQNVVIIATTNAIGEGGVETSMVGNAMIGDPAHEEMLLARALGRAERERATRVGEQRRTPRHA